MKKDEEEQKNKNVLQSALALQNRAKKSLLSVMQSFGESTDSIDINSVDAIQEFLQDLKVSLDLCNKNISTLEKLSKEIDSISFENSTTLIEPEISIKEDISNNIPISSENKNNYKENTLVISETNGIVVLPYELSKLQMELENSNNRFSSIDEIINKQYSLPIAIYKNPFVARFRESYKLMRYREKGSVKEAFDLGLELMFNYNLHPAIISACKNLDELDIYLDYLESGETDKFKIFKVLFEIAPTIVKAKHEM